MTAQQRKYAVKLYQRKIKEDPKYNADKFYKDVSSYISTEFPAPKNLYDPAGLRADTNKLWVVISMNMKDVVKRSGMNMREFSDRFFIPYRTLQAWCDDTNPCPLYTKLLLCDALKFISVDIPWGSPKG